MSVVSNITIHLDADTQWELQDLAGTVGLLTRPGDGSLIWLIMDAGGAKSLAAAVSRAAGLLAPESAAAPRVVRPLAVIGTLADALDEFPPGVLDKAISDSAARVREITDVHISDPASAMGSLEMLLDELRKHAEVLARAAEAAPAALPGAVQVSVDRIRELAAVTPPAGADDWKYRSWILTQLGMLGYHAEFLAVLITTGKEARI